MFSSGLNNNSSSGGGGGGGLRSSGGGKLSRQMSAPVDSLFQTRFEAAEREISILSRSITELQNRLQDTTKLLLDESTKIVTLATHTRSTADKQFKELYTKSADMKMRAAEFTDYITKSHVALEKRLVGR
jgi:hypothetical protein